MNIRAVIVSAITLTCLLALAACSSDEDGERIVRIGVDVPYAPFQYTDEQGNVTGFEVRVINAACEEMALTCEWITQAWDGIIPSLHSGRYDLIASSMTITPERMQQVQFSEPYIANPSAWFAPDASEFDADNLNGTRIGVQRGTTQDDYVSDNLAEVVDLRRYATADDMIIDLINGRLDAVLVNALVGEENIASRPGLSRSGELVVMGMGVGAAFRPNDTELLATFNEGLQRIKDNGTYEELMEEYFTINIMM